MTMKNSDPKKMFDEGVQLAQQHKRCGYATFDWFDVERLLSPLFMYSAGDIKKLADFCKLAVSDGYPANKNYTQNLVDRFQHAQGYQQACESETPGLFGFLKL